MRDDVSEKRVSKTSFPHLLWRERVGRSVFPRGNELGEAAKVCGAAAEGFECFECFRHECFGVLPCGRQTHEFDVGWFVVVGVFAGGFAQCGGVGFAVEYVVYDLEGEAEAGGVAVEALQVVVGQVGTTEAAEGGGSADERACFQAVHLFEFALGDAAADVGEIDGLPARHAEAAGGAREGGEHVQLALRRQGGGAAEEVEGEGLQGIACEQGGGFAVADVAGGAAAPQAVVVHGGHVVVNEGVDVYEFDGRHRGFDGIGNGFAQFGGGKHEQGAQAFAAVEGGVAHGFVQALRELVFRRHQACQQQFGLRLRLCLPGFQFIRRH